MDSLYLDHQASDVYGRDMLVDSFGIHIFAKIRKGGFSSSKNAGNIFSPSDPEKVINDIVILLEVGSLDIVKVIEVGYPESVSELGRINAMKFMNLPSSDSSLNYLFIVTGKEEGIKFVHSPDGSLVDTTGCTGCSQCPKGATSKCLKCAPGSFLQDFSCTGTCQGFVFNTPNNVDTCKKCHPSCLTCTTPLGILYKRTGCDTCHADYTTKPSLDLVPEDPTMINSLPNGCYNLQVGVFETEEGTAVSCPQEGYPFISTIWSDGTLTSQKCLTSCPHSTMITLLDTSPYLMPLDPADYSQNAGSRFLPGSSCASSSMAAQIDPTKPKDYISINLKDMDEDIPNGFTVSMWFKSDQTLDKAMLLKVMKIVEIRIENGGFISL